MKDEELPKRMSSGKHTIAVDKIDCCMKCVRRSKRKKRSPRKKRKKTK